MKQKHLLTFCLFFLFSVFNTTAQEEAPLKTFEFSISINKLKTEQQASDIRTEVKSLPGIKDCQLVLTDYTLIFSCTNHDLYDYLIMDRIKAIIVENGAEIVNVNRKEI
ncbi:MAG: hypothetical protein HUJ25_18170 [Crocinitomicaceae bacterium]|nr:hypothetical protein [Crocinitomicaceae bacterium]